MKQKYPIHKNVIKRLNKDNAVSLYEKLIEKRAEIQNRPQASKQALSKLGTEKGGDQADLVNRQQQESQYMDRIQRDSRRLEEIINALARMESGNYGICDETGDLIELKRLLTTPWTTLSIEGAEEREENIKKFGIASSR